MESIKSGTPSFSVRSSEIAIIKPPVTTPAILIREQHTIANTIRSLADEVGDLEAQIVILKNGSPSPEEENLIPLSEKDHESTIKKLETSRNRIQQDLNTCNQQCTKVYEYIETVDRKQTNKTKEFKELLEKHKKAHEPSLTIPAKNLPSSIIFEGRSGLNMKRKLQGEIKLLNLSIQGLEKEEKSAKIRLIIKQVAIIQKSREELIILITQILRIVKKSVKEQNFSENLKDTFTLINDPQSNALDAIRSFLALTAQIKLGASQSIEKVIVNYFVDYLIEKKTLSANVIKIVKANTQSQAAFKEIHKELFKKLQFLHNYVLVNKIKNEEFIIEENFATREALKKEYLKELGIDKPIETKLALLGLSKYKKLEANLIKSQRIFKGILQAGRDELVRTLDFKRDDNVIKELGDAMVKEEKYNPLGEAIKIFYKKEINKKKEAIKNIEKKPLKNKQVSTSLQERELAEQEWRNIASIRAKGESIPDDTKISRLRGDLLNFSNSEKEAFIEYNTLSEKTLTLSAELINLNKKITKNQNALEEIRSKKKENKEQKILNEAERDAEIKSLTEKLDTLLLANLGTDNSIVLKVVSPKALNLVMTRHLGKEPKEMNARLKKMEETVRLFPRTGTYLSHASLLRVIADMADHMATVKGGSLLTADTENNLQENAFNSLNVPRGDWISMLCRHDRLVGEGVRKNTTGIQEGQKICTSRYTVGWEDGRACITHFDPWVSPY